MVLDFDFGDALVIDAVLDRVNGYAGDDLELVAELEDLGTEAVVDPVEVAGRQSLASSPQP